MTQRFIFTVLSLLLCSSTAFAGFEWVEPVRKSTPPQMQQRQVQAPVQNKGIAVPAPRVSALPLGNKPILSVPTIKTTAAPTKLVINPYPLHGSAASQPVSMNEISRAMNENAGQVHPVQLGNGMATTARPKVSRVAASLNKAASDISSFQKSMTPMIARDQKMMSGGGVPRAPVERVGSSNTYAQAVGFGRDLPMVLALSQIIPSGFTHSFAKDVNTGAVVSWEGGKAWNQVLNDMLRPKNLTAVIQGNKVVIQPMAKL